MGADHVPPIPGAPGGTCPTSPSSYRERMYLPSPGTVGGHPRPCPPSSCRAPLAGPPPGTSPFPGDPSFWDFSPAPSGALRHRVPRTHRRSIPRTAFRSPSHVPRGASAAYAGDLASSAPRSTARLWRKPGGHVHVSPSLPSPWRLPLGPSREAPPRVLLRLLVGSPSSTLARGVLQCRSLPRSRTPRQALPGVPRRVPPRDVLPPLAGPSLSTRYDTPDLQRDREPPSPGLVGDDHRPRRPLPGPPERSGGPIAHLERPATTAGPRVTADSRCPSPISKLALAVPSPGGRRRRSRSSTRPPNPVRLAHPSPRAPGVLAPWLGSSGSHGAIAWRALMVPVSWLPALPGGPGRAPHLPRTGRVVDAVPTSWPDPCPDRPGGGGRVRDRRRPNPWLVEQVGAPGPGRPARRAGGSGRWDGDCGAAPPVSRPEVGTLEPGDIIALPRRWLRPNPLPVRFELGSPYSLPNNS